MERKAFQEKPVEWWARRRGLAGGDRVGYGETPRALLAAPHWELVDF